MTKHQLRALLERAADWPKEAQAELLRSMVQIEAKYGGVYHVDDEERMALEESAEDIRRQHYATDEAVETVFARFRNA